MICWCFLLFIFAGYAPGLGARELILPKQAALLTPTQQQYELILIAFRHSIGHQETSHENGQPSIQASGELAAAPRLPLATQTEMALELMSQLDTPRGTQGEKAIFPPDAWQSLRLISQEPSVLSGIAPDMQTIWGKIFLARLLTAPTTDVDRIRARQKAIEVFSKDRTLLENIRAICNTVGQVQEPLLGLTNTDHPLYDKGLRIYQHEFFFRSFGPRGRQGWNRFAKLFGDVWYGAGVVALPLLTTKAVLGYTRMSVEEIERRFKANHLFVATIAALLIAYNAGIQLPGIISWIRARFRAIDYFYTTLLPLKVFFSATDRLHKIFRENAALQDLADEIDDELMIDHPKIKKLRAIIMGAAFNSRKSAHLRGGDLILIIDLLRDCQKTILKGIGLIGAFDAYSSLASWYLASKSDDTKPLCFASFIKNASAPFIEIDNFWHVLTRDVKPVLNSIKLGDGCPQNAIITGIFESGKSTTLQSVALNVLAAQSIGICLARSYTATPYSSIHVYANIKDDLANDRSLFKTELYRALQLLEQIKKMPQHHFSFTVADATFTGTEAGAGQAAAYAVARYLGELQNSISLHATNFLSLSILGAQDPARFTNYILPSIFDGKTVQTYKLTPGIQSHKLSTTIFKEEGLPAAMVAEIEKQLANMES